MTQKQIIELSIDDLRTVVREQLEVFLPQYLEKGDDTKEPTELLSVKEAAQFLNVHPNTIYNWVKDGRIQKQSIGRKLVFNKADLLENLKTDTILGGDYE